jgi:cysteine-rich CWC protein
VQKVCAKCGLPFECASPASDCWCMTVLAWESVRASALEKYKDCLCKTCLSLAFYHPSTLKNVWGLPT